MPHGFICLECSKIVGAITMGRCEDCAEDWRGRNPRRDGKRTGERRPARQRRETPLRSLSQSVYRTAKWKRVRSEAIARDGGVCRLCGTDQNLTVHHLIAISRDPSLAYEPTNLATMCRKCHGMLDGGKAAASKRVNRAR